MRIFIPILVLGTFVAAQMGSSTPSKAFDLDGAWTAQADVCKKIFVKTGNKISFAKDAELHGYGFIVDGNAIQAHTAKCSVKARKEDGAVTHLIATCATGIMVDQTQLSFKVVDDNKITRLFPGMEIFQTSYVRCPFTGDPKSK